jgi:hypothetical protein
MAMLLLEFLFGIFGLVYVGAWLRARFIDGQPLGASYTNRGPYIVIYQKCPTPPYSDATHPESLIRLEVGLPDPIRSIFQGLEQGTSLQLEGLECAEKGWDGFFAPFGFACALPLCVLMASPLLSLASDLWQRFRNSSHPLSFRAKLVLSFSYLWLVLVFGASRRILSALNCTD